MLRWNRILALGLLVVGCGDDPPGFTRVKANGYFMPEMIDFQTRPFGTHRADLAFSNASAGALTINDILFEPATDAYVPKLKNNAAFKGITIKAGERRDLDMVFGPSEEKSYDSTMVLVSDTLQIELPLKGIGRMTRPARLELSPASITFVDPIEVGREVSQTLTMRNVGELSGRLINVMLPSGMRITDMNNVPVTPTPGIEPGGSMTLDLHFRPNAPGPFELTATFYTEGNLSTPLVVRGTAIQAGSLSCDRSQIMFNQVTRGSTARQLVQCTVSGGAYTLQDLALNPATPNLSIQNASALAGNAITTLNFEVVWLSAGVARNMNSAVVITAAHGEIDTINVSGEVVPPAAQSTELKVTLTWPEMSDLDLHLVRAGGMPFQRDQDCHYGQKTINWNQSGTDLDDPFLDQDARMGPATEQINLIDAATGVYEIYVQYADYDTARGAISTATVRYDVMGGPTGTRTFNLTPCGLTWFVGTLDFSNSPATFTAADTTTMMYSSLTDNCQ